MRTPDPNPTRPSTLSRSAAITLATILVLAAGLRANYGRDNPLTGDEAGVGLLQASGQSGAYEDATFSDRPVPLESIRSFTEYSDRFGLSDVVASLRFHGMHPPLYYVLLHGVQKYVGADTALLRSISLLFSLASILLIFAIGARLGGVWTGLFAAAVLAFSGYGIKYGVLVRPYPMAMTLALASTLLALRLKREDGGIRPATAILFGLTLLAGIYTIYHFIFVCVFQAVFLIASPPRDRRTQAWIIAVFLAVGLAYLPWLPVLADQLTDVRHVPYYFYGSLRLYSVLASTAGLAFWIGLLNVWAPLGLGLLLVVPFAFVAWGYLTSLASSRLRALALAGIAAVAANLLADLVMGTITIEIPKIAFFFVPLSILFLALGVRRVPGPRASRYIAAALALALLGPGTTSLVLRKQTWDGPLCLFAGRETARHFASEGGRPLVVAGIRARRYLPPLSRMVDSPADALVRSRCDAADALAPAVEGGYGPVLVLWPANPRCGVPRAAVARSLLAGARDHGFSLAEEHRVGKCALLLFE